jgi:hypothetical protein
MKDLDPLVFYYVFVEMMGPWLLWSLVLAAIFGLWAFFSVVIRERGISSKRLVRSEIAGLFGGAGALVLMAHVTMSGFTDAGGPVDWLLVGLIWGAGLAGTTILSYALLGLIEQRRTRYSRSF